MARRVSPFLWQATWASIVGLVDISKKYANTTIWIDGNTGAKKESWLPTGESASDTFSTWIYQLHFGTVAAFGWPYRAFILATGLLVSALSASGVWIWWRKNRSVSGRRDGAPRAPASGSRY